MFSIYVAFQTLPNSLSNVVYCYVGQTDGQKTRKITRQSRIEKQTK